MNSVPSIHYKRRWYYVLWCALLLASLTVLGLWEMPVRSGMADLSFKIQVTNVPAGCAVQFWAGPKKTWPVASKKAPMNQPGLPLTTTGEVVGHLSLRVAYRRWVGSYIPSRTDDLAVLKVQPKIGAPRYYAFPLDGDWHARVLHPGQRMMISGTIAWDGMWLDPTLVPKTLGP